jgi:hypothetical protein
MELEIPEQKHESSVLTSMQKSSPKTKILECEEEVISEYESSSLDKEPSNS